MSYYDSEDQGHEYDDYFILVTEKENRMADYTTVFVSGTVYWAKILGKPVTNYDGDGKEWTYQFVPDDTNFLKEHKLLDRLKEDKKGLIEGEFLNLKKPELNSDGEKNDPIRVYNSDNEAWDPSVLIGNGSRVDAKLTIVDWGKTKKKSIWTAALRVTDLVPYTSNEFAGMDGGAVKAKTSKAKTKVAALEDLDDDLPPFE